MRRLLFGVWACLAAAASAQAPAPAQHVVLVTIDGLRGDYISPHDP